MVFQLKELNGYNKVRIKLFETDTIVYFWKNISAVMLFLNL